MPPPSNINPRLFAGEAPVQREYNLDQLADQLRAGDRGALSRAITLIESSRPQDRPLAHELVRRCQEFAVDSFRIAITGIPGAGKSTFIEALGQLLVEDRHRLAVLAIDPSSERSGGSILGDKTRMSALSGHDDVFIRPSPTRGALGGVARATRESIVLCEAAGYDLILVETVGVGQAEIAVHSLVDCFLLLAVAGTGDELQGIKRGIMEMADVLVVNKADGENKPRAEKAAHTLQQALQLLPAPDSGWTPRVHTCSALHQTGLREIWETLQAYREYAKRSGYLDDNRRRQATRWMHQLIEDAVRQEFYRHDAVSKMLPALEEKVGAGAMSPLTAAEELLASYRGDRSE